MRIAAAPALALAAFAAAGALAATASAVVNIDYVDIGRDQVNEAFVREAPWLPTSNVGAKCYAVTASETMTIRPPAVRALKGLGSSSEKVWWRAEFLDTTGQAVHYGAWVVGAATRTHPTEFGSGSDPSSFNVYADSYYQGGESWSRSNSDGSRPLVPYIEVAWRRPHTVLYRWMRVHRVVVQVGYSTQGPAYDGTC